MNYSRSILIGFLCGLAAFVVIHGWGLGALIAAAGFAYLYGSKAADWLNS